MKSHSQQNQIGDQTSGNIVESAENSIKSPLHPVNTHRFSDDGISLNGSSKEYRKTFGKQFGSAIFSPNQGIESGMCARKIRILFHLLQKVSFVWCSARDVPGIPSETPRRIQLASFKLCTPEEERDCLVVIRHLLICETKMGLVSYYSRSKVCSVATTR